MTTQAMTTHKIGNNTFTVFSKEEKGGVWLLHFLWGKKDFRLYLGRKADMGTAELPASPTLESEAQGEVLVTQLQYLNAFEWYDFVKIAGHGLAMEEVCWARGKLRRYVELPKGFQEIAVELACREFGLTRHSAQKAS